MILKTQRCHGNVTGHNKKIETFFRNLGKKWKDETFIFENRENSERNEFYVTIKKIPRKILNLSQFLALIKRSFGSYFKELFLYFLDDDNDVIIEIVNYIKNPKTNPSVIEMKSKPIKNLNAILKPFNDNYHRKGLIRNFCLSFNGSIVTEFLSDCSEYVVKHAQKKKKLGIEIWVSNFADKVSFNKINDFYIMWIGNNSDRYTEFMENPTVYLETKKLCFWFDLKSPNTRKINKV